MPASCGFRNAVYPDCFEKCLYRELRINVPRQGVRAYLAALLARLPEEVKRVAEDVYRVDVGELGVVVCVADYCTDERSLTRDWASTHPTCYVVVNPRAATERFLQEDWLARVTLAEIISGQADLGELLRQTAATGIPGALKNVSVPVYSRGPLPIEVEPRRSSRRGRLFVVEVGSVGVRIEGESVMAAQADTRYQVFRILWDGFVEDLRGGVPCGRFRVMKLDRIMEQLQLRTGRQVVDELSVRRTVNRLQSDLATTVKKRLGLPIDREDIIQTCRWKGQNAFEHGYRINPGTVAVRPFAPSA